MGQKVHPYSFRIMNGFGWKSNWFAGKKHFAKFLRQDEIIRHTIKSKLSNAGLADITIERVSEKVVVTILTSKPGVVIGRDGAAIDQIKALLHKKLQTRDLEVKVEEIRKPEIVAALVADNVGRQIERRMPYRRVVKQALEKAMESGAKGCKIKVSGRLNGAEIARSETYKKGGIPLHTIRSHVDYALYAADTTYGKIGIKVWICKGEF